ncbi:hypothetical protein KSF_076790 [Reticulibacter mediterranei]|uniref:Uncharacterized protein n=1 Tax=Reticulibacter mediterranei TaxID=2778369 RepID=A0A8J3IN59_9CHLR|nr:hypothetical protein KSF_076790 [Reticulibacter mediterranei]
MVKFNDVFHSTSSLDKDTQPSTPGSSGDTWLFTPGSDKSTRLTTPGSDKSSALDVMKLHVALEQEQQRNRVERRTYEKVPKSSPSRGSNARIQLPC